MSVNFCKCLRCSLEQVLVYGTIGCTLLIALFSWRWYVVFEDIFLNLGMCWVVIIHIRSDRRAGSPWVDRAVLSVAWHAIIIQMCG